MKPRQCISTSPESDRPRRRGEGLRIGTLRFLPRGVRKAEYAARDLFDVWLPTLAPSRALLTATLAQGLTAATFAKFAAKYRRAMQRTDARQAIQFLATIGKRTPIAVGCYCDNESCCHRSVLIKLIHEAAAEATS
jgi:uncharacterized protein YeaO (DUF488 family)